MHDNLPRLLFSLLLGLFLFPIAATADVVKGRVVDAETSEPLAGALIDVDISGELYADDHLTTDSLGAFISPDWWTCVGTVKTTLCINYFGYHQGQKVTTLFEGTDTLDLGDILLKPSSELRRGITLGQATVTARHRRFTMQGDTVVFHPEAFHLEEGARLDELIRQLPGVSLSEGRLMWNGRPLLLKLNGQDALAGGDFLSHLPAEVVQCIKAYEKQSELAERTGFDDGQGQQVLDIVVKPRFMDRFYGQAAAQLATNLNYGATADVQQLSDDHPLALYLRLSDGGDCETDRGWGRAGSASGGEYRQQMGWVGYKHAWDSPHAAARWRDNWSIEATPNHYDATTSAWGRAERFTPDGGSTIVCRTTDSDAHTLSLPISLAWATNLSGANTQRGKVSLLFTDASTDSRTDASTYDDPTAAPVNTATTGALDRSRREQVELAQNLVHNTSKGHVGLNLWLSAAADRGASTTTADYTFRDAAPRREVQTGTTQGRALEGNLAASASHILGKVLQLRGTYTVSLADNISRDDRTRGDGATMAPDLQNTFRRHQRQMGHALEFALTENVGKVVLSQTGTVAWRREWLNYRRGAALDTAACRSLWLPELKADMKWRTAKASSLTLGLDYSRTAPDFLNTMAFTDDTNPLNITFGNPALRPSASLGATALYQQAIVRGEQNMKVELSAHRTLHPIVPLVSYDSATGAYRSTQINGRNGWRLQFAPSYDRSLGGAFRLVADAEASHRVAYGHLTALDGAAPAELRQLTTSGRLSLRFTYDSKRWNASLTLPATCSAFSSTVLGGAATAGGDLSATSTGTVANGGDATVPNGDICLLSYRPTLSATLKLTHWTFRLTSTLEGGHGNASDELNRCRFVAGGEATWNFLHGKGRLSLTADDVLNQRSRTWSRVTTSGRAEGGTEIVHHYLGLRFTYHFDAKNKP